eukprot:1139471-Pelagomonas_calceolata.AAC.5
MHATGAQTALYQKAYGRLIGIPYIQPIRSGKWVGKTKLASYICKQEIDLTTHAPCQVMQLGLVVYT